MTRLTILMLAALAAYAADGAFAVTQDHQAGAGQAFEAGAPSVTSTVEEAPEAAGRPYVPLTGKDRFDYYTRRTFLSPGAFFRSAGPSLGNHLNNRPAEWGQGAKGFSRRFADRFGHSVLKQTYEAAGAAALGHEVRYIPSTRAGFLPRARHALAATFVTYDRRGRRTPHLSRLGAAFAGEFTGNLWMPPGYRTATDTVRGAGIDLGVNSLFNLLREFTPELKRVLPWE